MVCFWSGVCYDNFLSIDCALVRAPVEWVDPWAVNKKKV